MNMTSIGSRVAFCVVLAGLLASCKSIKEDNLHAKTKGQPASGPEFHAIAFKSGHPIDSEELMDAVTEVDAAIAAMRHNVGLINSIQSVNYSVVGTTDNAECSGEACDVLSLKRARLVQDWLTRNGVPALRFRQPVGRGSPMPRDYISNEEERSMTRSVRVEID